MEANGFLLLSKAFAVRAVQTPHRASASAYSALAAKSREEREAPTGPVSPTRAAAVAQAGAGSAESNGETVEETESRAHQLQFWVSRLREEKDTGAIYMLREILRKPKKATSSAPSPRLDKRLERTGTQEEKPVSAARPPETEDILDQMEDLLRSHGEMTAEVGELLSYRHQTRREGRKELLALGFTGFSTAFAAAIHPFFFLGTLIGLRSILKARAPELDREAGARRLQEIKDSLRTQEKQLFRLSETLLELEDAKPRKKEA
ncbi:putative transmembrane protein [Toxoplasma gondii VAND]|uniref:Putative transmembrane protein n=1 Tax=Toxoplasma gondii VAND TaxID=933077 RepID=A0A086PHK3_TOXGO|nr:putative transmembrane protein [Toxoplasma gondii VAND]